MTNLKGKFNLIPKEQRETLVREISTYFATEKDIELGMLAAEDILDFFVNAIGGHIYNKAIHDAKATLQQSQENLSIDLDLLTK